MISRTIILVDIRTSHQLALLSLFDVRSRNSISRSVAIIEIFRFFNVYFIYKKRTFRLTTGSTIFDDSWDSIINSARYPLVLNTHRITKRHQKLVQFMIRLGLLSYKNGIHSLTYRIILLRCIVMSHTEGNDICELYVISRRIYIPRSSFERRK